MKVEILVQRQDEMEPLDASAALPSTAFEHPFFDLEIRVDDKVAFRLEQGKQAMMDFEEWNTLNEFLKMFDICQPLFDDVMAYGTAAVTRREDGTIERVDPRRLRIQADAP